MSDDKQHPSASRLPVRISWALERSPASPGDRVLEIGCGSGRAIQGLIDRVGDAGFVMGVDRSAIAIAQARRRHQANIEAGRVEFRIVEFEALEPGAAFHVVLAVNVNAFWTNPERAFARAATLLKPDGRMLLVYEAPAQAKLDDITGKLSAPGVARDCRLSRSERLADTNLAGFTFVRR